MFCEHRGRAIIRVGKREKENWKRKQNLLCNYKRGGEMWNGVREGKYIILG